ncbi:MAG: LCCL domain-containing protein [Novosphingobium sp.]|nr:LCCL domain-containing protein [Novosphingobium sp.]
MSRFIGRKLLSIIGFFLIACISVFYISSEILAQASTGYLHFPNKSIPGRNITTLQNQSPQSCAAACNANSSCKSFDMDKSGNCWLQDANRSDVSLSDSSTYNYYERPTGSGSGHANAQASSNSPENIGNCPTNATGYRGSGGSYTCSCSTAASGSGNVWGTYVYTDESAICRAAVQAGVISAGGGQVIFNILPGRSSYKGTGGGTHNGVSSSDYGSWQGSYKFAPWAPPVRSSSGGRASSGSPARQTASHFGACPANATDYRNSGKTITCACGSSETTSGSVWGNDTYTDDSKICRAAVHAGVIGSGGGQVTFIMIGGQSAYQSTSRNGVSSSSYGSWHGSYRFLRARTTTDTAQRTTTRTTPRTNSSAVTTNRGPDGFVCVLGTTLPGRNIATLQNQTARSCAIACGKRTGCKSFDMDRQGNCWLQDANRMSGKVVSSSTYDYCEPLNSSN